LGTALATIVTVLVNGTTIARTVLRSKDGEGKKEENEKTEYTLDIRTQDERTTLTADGEDRLWIYAKLTCSKPSVSSQSLTAGINFSFGGEYANWMSIKQIQFKDGYKAGQLAAEPPSAEAEIKEGANVTVSVSGSTAEGEPIEAPVTIELEGELQLKVTILA
jgi:hypothetical protein